jgi:acyl-CoA synthetase (AMP-forming)/AMP-acid ligase II
VPGTFADVVREAGRRYGNRPVYVRPDGVALSYAQLDRRSESVAVGLAERGLAPGDVVAVLLPSGPAYAVAVAATAKLGATCAGVNDRLSSPERLACLDLVDPKLVLATPTLAASTDLRRWTGVGAVVEVEPDTPSEETLAELDGPGDLPPLPPDPDRPVAIVFTSGTTGTPKAAVFAQRQLDAISMIDGGRRWGGGGRALASTSFAHLGFMTKLPQALRGGGTTFIIGRWSAGEALAMVERHRLTSLGGIPTQVALMLRHDRWASTDVSSVRMLALGGGPSPAALVREARERFGAPVVVRYTCTEAGVGVGTRPDDPPEDAEESVGRARAGVELTVRDSEGRRLGVGEIGEVCLRSEAVMAGYFRDAAATAAVLTDDGAVQTGDLGWLDERGRLHLSGRSREMFVRGGYNVFPFEVETALADHPEVGHVAVAPRPDDVMGEIGVAVVVPRHRGSPPTLASLRRHAQARLARHKLPEALVVTDELPRTSTEKLDRRRLADLADPATENPAVGARRNDTDTDVR